MRLKVVSALAVAVLAVVVLARFVWPIPAPARTYVALSILGGALVVYGSILLTFVIPIAGVLSRDVKTEFFSARAAYFCIVAGLVLLAIVTLGAVVASVTLTIMGR